MTVDRFTVKRYLDLVFDYFICEGFKFVTISDEKKGKKNK